MNDDKAGRRLTTAAVLLVALIAAVVSYIHIEHLAVVNGQTALAAYLLPLSIDGTVVASSMTMLRAARAGLRTPWLARFGLVLSVAATLAANIGYGVAHGLAGALMSGWPAAAFIISAEMAIGMVRRTVPKSGEKATRKATPEAAQEATQEPASRATGKATPRATRKATGQATAKATTGGAEEATEATRRAIREGHPVPSARALARSHHISRETAGKVLATVGAEANGHGQLTSP